MRSRSVANMAAVAPQKGLVKSLTRGPRTPELAGLSNPGFDANHLNASFQKIECISNGSRVLHQENTPDCAKWGLPTLSNTLVARQKSHI
jgi:hypothetical protein